MSTINYTRKIGPLIVCFHISEVESKRLVKHTKKQQKLIWQKNTICDRDLEVFKDKLFINRLNVVWLLGNPHWLSNVETT